MSIIRRFTADNGGLFDRTEGDDEDCVVGDSDCGGLPSSSADSFLDEGAICLSGGFLIRRFRRLRDLIWNWTPLLC